ncbi:hypothetical protein TIFTF001_041417 [Ficus carica]|uniref:Retrotransposon gag domain-containing protein n=1 Tax=Ficus carica TaxID=3494 RepID=A0AA87Z4X4_FICCA|nr:hypothetical protein TIFTF001_041414 [Ficus carica]GMN30213.1 hypothetical protein TIFTF001_041415 [Ficus carica]GMN30224.1 hypothetical protein TIFTF001_041416 [Ficus carica]GMN30227.1 hypothetical protein TIFTF001_041417 [Ficus carica]
MVSERFPISYHASPRIHFKLLQIVRGRGRGNGRVQAEDEVAAETNLAEVMAQLRQDQRRGRGQDENEAVAEPNLVEIVAQLQRQVQQQQALINTLQANANRVEVPIDPPAAQPVQNRGVQAATNHEPLYLRFKRMKPKEFNGSTDPLVAQGWLKSIELVLNFMDLTDNEKVKCASYCLMDDARIWEHYDEFNNFRQGNLSVTEDVKRFNQLVRLCPHMVPNEQERLRRMIGMLKPEIAVIVDSGTAPPTTTAECIKCALRADYHLNKQKESQPRWDEVPKNNNNNQNRGNFGNQGKSQGGQWNINKRKGNFSNQRNHNNRQGGGQPAKQARNIPPCSKCGKLHLGECRMGTNLCYGYGREGHLYKDCPNKTYQPFQQRQQRNPPAQLHMMMSTHWLRAVPMRIVD